MSEPPPSPLETSASIPLNDHTLNIPSLPSLGSQRFRAISAGVRGNDPGGYGFPRSSRQTRLPASARRYAVTDPPKPEPTTTASKCSSSVVLNSRLSPVANWIPAAEGERTARPREVQARGGAAAALTSTARRG